VALPVLARRPEGKRVRRARRVLRQLTRTAGQSRDLDVSLGLLDNRLETATPPSRETRLLRRRLRSARGRSRRRMAEALLDLEIARLRRDLRAVLRRRAEPIFTVTLRLRALREQHGGGLLEELAAVATRFDAPALHGLRRRVRRLRYVAELSERLRGQDSESPGLLKDLQDQLGRVHDLFVLSEWLSRQASAAGRAGDGPLETVARLLAEAALAESREAHEAFLANDPAETVRRAVEAIAVARAPAAPGPVGAVVEGGSE
jgi:CHAD domain-containing protein